MAAIDKKDAYYSVPIHPYNQKYLRFSYQGKLYQYTVFPNGLSVCPRKFTKLMKPIFAHIRLQNYVISGYIDDFYLQANTYAGCVANVVNTLKLFDNA